MLDERPSAAELVAAVSAFIENKVTPQLDTHTAFHAKIAINALRIVERELLQGDACATAERTRLLALLGDTVGVDAGLADLNAALCARINEGSLGHDDPALRTHLRQSVLDRLAIDNPKYPSLSSARS